MTAPDHSPAAGKKMYTPTRLRRYGSITALTAGTGSMNGDAGQAMMTGI